MDVSLLEDLLERTRALSLSDADEFQSVLIDVSKALDLCPFDLASAAHVRLSQAEGWVRGSGFPKSSKRLLLKAYLKKQLKRRIAKNRDTEKASRDED